VSAAPSASALDTARIAQIVGAPGEQSGAVYKITVGRDDLKLTEMGAPINARMGLNTWRRSSAPTKTRRWRVTSPMLANELTPVLKTLRMNGLDVVAIHHHMTDTRPPVYFLHYWGTDRLSIWRTRQALSDNWPIQLMHTTPPLRDSWSRRPCPGHNC